MKKFSIILALILVSVFISSCTNTTTSNILSNKAEKGSLLINYIEYKERAPYEVQYIYEVEDFKFDGDFPNDSQKKIKDSHKYYIKAYRCNKGEQISVGTFDKGEVTATVGKEVLVLRPKAIDKDYTYLIYGYRHYLSIKSEFIPSVDNVDSIYNDIFECSKEHIYIDYVVQ